MRSVRCRTIAAFFTVGELEPLGMSLYATACSEADNGIRDQSHER
jgi:hypothetical protein